MDATSPAWAVALGDALKRDNPGIEVQAVAPLPGGACQDNFRVQLAVDGKPRFKVLRADARKSLPGSLDRRSEFPVIGAAVEAGVPTPDAHPLFEGLTRAGASSYLLDWVDGVAIGAKVTRDPRLEPARAVLIPQLADALARIHTITPKTHPHLPLTSPHSAVAGTTAVDAALHFTRKMMDDMPRPHPGMELTWRWLDRHRPAELETVLVHGDFRTGNFMVTPQGLAGVLDWEFCHWGDPHCDIAWLCVRDWRFGQLTKPVGGIGQRGDFYRAYTAASGRGIDPVAVHWWEVMGNARWGAGAVFQAQRVLSGAEGDLELLAIGRRAAEMEWEALRLIKQGVT